MGGIVRADEIAEEHGVGSPLDHHVARAEPHGGALPLPPTRCHAAEPHDRPGRPDAHTVQAPQVTHHAAGQTGDHEEEQHAAPAEQLLHHGSDLGEGEQVEADVPQPRVQKDAGYPAPVLAR